MLCQFHMYSSQIDLFHTIRHAGQRLSGRDEANPFQIIVEAVAIGAIIYLAKISMRIVFRGNFFGDQGRGR